MVPVSNGEELDVVGFARRNAQYGGKVGAGGGISCTYSYRL